MADPAATRKVTAVTAAYTSASVRNRMSDVLKALGDGEFHPFEHLFNAEEGRLGIIVTFLALLELAKEHLIELMQREPLAPIYLKSLAT